MREQLIKGMEHQIVMKKNELSVAVANGDTSLEGELQSKLSEIESKLDDIKFNDRWFIRN